MKIISIGCNCDVGFFIKNNFNSEYYPFDWIWSNIDFVIKTFETDYFEFTECENLNAVWVPHSKHTYIFNTNCKGDESERICSAVSVHDSDSHSQNYGLALQKAEPSELIEAFLTLISGLSLCYL